MILLILGGSRSGKSSRAENLASQSGRPVVYVATWATGIRDAEMERRIEVHRLRRPNHWKTIENRFDLKNIIAEQDESVVLLDCLTLWLSYKDSMGLSHSDILSELEEALVAAIKLGRYLILVSNELGWGMIPPSFEARKFRDLSGAANQLVAKHATSVELMVAGLSLPLKGKL